MDPKKRTLGATERDERHRLMWHRILRNIDARRLVFVDEFGVNIRLARLFGWAPRGDRSRGLVPRNYGKNLSVCAALSLEGITAVMTIEGALDAHPAGFLDEHCRWWEEQTGIRVSTATMCREIKRLGVTRNKGRWVPPSKTSDAA